MLLPNCFVKNMQEILGEDFDKYQNSLTQEAKRGFRLNYNYIDKESFKNIFNYPYKEIEGFDGLCELLTSEKIGNSICHHLGLVYLQEPSSMLAAEALGVEEGDKVLDLCSAPGGKASQILDKNKTGEVVCNEIVRSRANILLSNIERQGFKNAVVTSLPPSKLAESFENYFDKILVDAPCSGEGMFRKDPPTISEWNENLPEFNHQRQMEILHEADKMLKNGGVLVYSTCTFNLEENERTIYEFAEKYGYEIVPLPKNVQQKTVSGKVYSGKTETAFSGRVFPHNNYGEGQFIAKLSKKSEKLSINNAKRQKIAELKGQEQKIVNDFIKEETTLKNYKLYKIGNNIYLYNGDILFLKDGVVSLGVNVGSVEKNRLIPHHQFFKAYGEYFKNKINLDFSDGRVLTYMSGNEFNIDNAKNGFACVLVGRAVLGGGKIVNGKLKNYYPKGLRVKI